MSSSVSNDVPDFLQLMTLTQEAGVSFNDYLKSYLEYYPESNLSRATLQEMNELTCSSFVALTNVFQRESDSVSKFFQIILSLQSSNEFFIPECFRDRFNVLRNYLREPTQKNHSKILIFSASFLMYCGLSFTQSLLLMEAVHMLELKTVTAVSSYVDQMNEFSLALDAEDARRLMGGLKILNQSGGSCALWMKSYVMGDL